MGSPVDDALDRLASIGWLSPQEAQDLATVRQRLADQDTEIERLREERDKARELLEGGIKVAYQDELGRIQRIIERAEAAEAEVRRYKKGLREIEHWPVDVGHTPERDLLNIKEQARALLAGSEAEPDKGGEA